MIVVAVAQTVLVAVVVVALLLVAVSVITALAVAAAAAAAVLIVAASFASEVFKSNRESKREIVEESPLPPPYVAMPSTGAAAVT